MLFLHELDRHWQLELVVLRYEHIKGTVYYKWKGGEAASSDCWMTKDGRVFLPADGTTIMLTEFFHHEIVWSCEEQRIRYIRMKQLKDIKSRENSKLFVEVNDKEALAGEEQSLAISF